MTDELMIADMVALMVVIEAVIEAVVLTDPSVRTTLDEAIQNAINELPDQESAHRTKATLQKFHQRITKNRPLIVPVSPVH